MTAAPRRPVIFWDVDTQVDFMHASGALYVPDAESILGNLGRLTEAARQRRIPVVASACDHESGDAELSDDPDLVDTYPPHCLRGTPGARRVGETTLPWTVELVHEPAPAETFVRLASADHPTALIHKKHFDVFSNPNTTRVLEALSPERIVVYGVALDVCNRAAIEGMLARGYRSITAVTDATRPIRAAAETRLLADWADRGVTLRTTNDLLSEMSREFATPNP